MKRLFGIWIFVLCHFVVFSQSSASISADVEFSDSTINHSQTSLSEQSSSSTLPLMIQQQATKSQSPVVSTIVSEIPNNDTVIPTVKIKVVTTEELVAKEKMFAEIASAPLDEKKTASDTKKFESFADSEDKEVIPGRTYKVQVYALQKELSAQIKDIQKKVGQKIPVTVDSDDGLKKYMVGVFDTYYDAIKYRDELVKKGFKGAFVVVYFKDKRVSRQEKGFVKTKTVETNEQTPKKK